MKTPPPFGIMTHRHQFRRAKSVQWRKTEKWNGETKPFSSEQFGNFITAAHQKGRGCVTVFEERKKEHGCAACHYSCTQREFMLVRWIIWIKTVLTPHTSRFPEVLTPFEISRMDHFSSHETLHWRKEKKENGIQFQERLLSYLLAF